MMDAKSRATASIAAAKLELDRALAEIDMIQTFNPMLIGLVAHSLSNYVSVTAATVEMLQITLRGNADPNVPIWLEGIGHTADLMQHSVSRLVSMSAPSDFPLKLDRVNLPVLMERACEYFRRRAGGSGAHITCAAVGSVPLVWGDRVALAVVADNLLSNAVRASNGNGPIRVQIMAEPGHVVCSVKDSGPGLSAAEQQRLFDAPLPPAAAPGNPPLHGYGLAVTREFLRRLDGELWCESEPGRGACFSFRLPAIE
jgi:signal transduction histidine kinase